MARGERIAFAYASVTTYRAKPSFRAKTERLNGRLIIMVISVHGAHALFLSLQFFVLFACLI
jgi:hypothetical protein